MRSWYLVQTKSRQEYTARENLERQGYVTYLPLTRITKRGQGKSNKGPGPLFPLYLFINLSEGDEDWGPIRSTLGVVKLVRFGHIPAKVPEKLIQAFKDMEDTDGLLTIPQEKFNIGEKVRISEGIFEGYEAVIHEKTPRERVVLLLKIIERQVKLELDIDQVDHLFR